MDPRLVLVVSVLARPELLGSRGTLARCAEVSDRRGANGMGSSENMVRLGAAVEGEDKLNPFETREDLQGIPDVGVRSSSLSLESCKSVG